MLAQEQGQDHSMMVASVVEYEDYATASRSILQQVREEALERCGIEDLANPAHAPKQATDLRVGACNKIGSFSSGGTHMRQREPRC